MAKWRGKTCGTCYHAWNPPGNKNLMQRVCRGGSPTIVGVPTNQGFALQAMFPPVQISDLACGSYLENDISSIEPIVIDQPKQDNELVQ
jgi:hypothetical protein